MGGKKSLRAWVNVWSRRLHRWGAVAVFVPLGVVVVTGILLLVKKDVGWVQPATVRAGAIEDGEPLVDLEGVLSAAKGAPRAGIAGWGDVARVDIRPKDGTAKVVGTSRWEVQVELRGGRVVSEAYRRSDLIESLHDGSWFHDRVKMWVFLPSGVVLLGLWATGMYLWVLPIWARRAGAARRASVGRGGGVGV
ncbi:MAG: PepSY domain-containing protein [Phycisphaeraceae bacterium]|nr:MAG: PepSY domain-containing protein [Phycisphaeraceae bacterium]